LNALRRFLASAQDGWLLERSLRMADQEEMTMLYSFTDQSASFVHGFEAGAISVRMKSDEPLIDLGYEEGFPIHSANVELLQRMCACYGYDLETKPTDYNEWTAARMEKRMKPRPTLAVVS
jgi:hypothetical protein